MAILSRKEIRQLKPGERYTTRDGRLGYKKTRKENFIDGVITVMSWIIYPLYHAGRFILRLLYGFLYPQTNFHHNGIIGPGGRTSYDQNFSWGRLSFIIVVSFIIIYFIFLQ